mmetsp:Transcript_28206/g.59018  ORF Transcript_28206/g.59018 Transcript_28206/m.59018 type:complete len:179 (-) Transcript_28206:250-786(-)|eukprot:CAMPEP_0172452610 /NCGR_PEP_ID=MMETSP1065-20121228/10221_1 /TAXON_ID=265537 /ORGANISM="Amphiprora paludosa, Strain CCMP125" /LENGTH=178 /DNA_ID=CAMNT_0013204695 /DNA_START=24 /DNA_END=560 /DNA_ORIENTATION=+
MTEESCSNDPAILSLVKEYLDSGGRNYQTQPVRDDGSIVISMSLTGNNSAFRTFIDLKIPQDRMLVFIESPVKVPEGEKRTICAELLMRINYTLALGNFEIDFRDGEVRYRMSVDVEGSSLSTQMVETNIMVSAATMDRYFPAIMAVVYGNKTPIEAIEEARNPPPSTQTETETSSSQ